MDDNKTKTPEALEVERLTALLTTGTAENDKLRRDLQSANDRLRNAAGDARREAAEAKAELARVKGEVEAEKGPPAGTFVCFQRPGEPFHRPGRVITDGFTASVRQTDGSIRMHAYIEIGEPPHVLHKDEDGKYFTPGHTFEVDRGYHPLGLPDTWHMPGECPYKDDQKKSAYAGTDVPAFAKNEAS